MKSLATCVAGLTAFGLAACATNGPVEPIPPAGPASADLRNGSGVAVARATASETGTGLRVRVESTGLAPGAYGVHVHTTGRCEAPGFESAGGHWNPTDRQHGAQNPAGPHLGDLPNLMVDTSGQGSFEFTIAGATIERLFDSDGAAVIVHAGPDDYRTDPSGNSGARIACGVLG